MSTRPRFAPTRAWSLFAGFFAVSLSPMLAHCHSGPDPVSHWQFNEETVKGGQVVPRLGPTLEVVGAPRLVAGDFGSALYFDGRQDYLAARSVREIDRRYLPTDGLTIAAWASVEPDHPDGWIHSLLERDGDAQRGCGLGYEQGRFCFALSSRGADDGNGRLTTIRAKKPLEPGRLCHIVGTYDGSEMRLYVDGALQATSREQFGPIYPPIAAAYVIGGAVDRDEQSLHRGLIREVAVYSLAAKEKWVAESFQRQERVAVERTTLDEEELTFVVEPYLQYATENQITVMWETSRPATGSVSFGAFGEAAMKRSGREEALIHEVRIDGLEPETPYHYKVEATDGAGRTIRSPLLTFQTASRPDSPFSFGVLADMQYNPKVCKRLADQLWMNRPNFVILPGDLTEVGSNKSHWTRHFFPGMQPLASRVPFYPVLGNHEEDHRHYYDYMSLPSPEYYYSFRYGNAEFFMIDSNREVGPGSEQYRWLSDRLRDSAATWKFVSYHHPTYSSDEDDYGDLWHGQPSTWGDLRMRPLDELYGKFGVDVVWNGHIHSYERTWPLRAGKAHPREGTIYMITGGAGGGLETAGPIKPWFQNTVKHGHHYCIASVNGLVLEFKAYDMEGRLFDSFSIEKSVDEAAAVDEVAVRP